jgi:predicted RNA-binding protein YlxR (DUF448 family)
MDNKLIRLRTCIITRKKLPQNMLVRIGLEKGVTLNESRIKIIRNNREIVGRTIYLQRDLKLLEVAFKKNALQRCFKLIRPLTSSEIDELRTYFQEIT